MHFSVYSDACVANTKGRKSLVSLCRTAMNSDSCALPHPTFPLLVGALSKAAGTDCRELFRFELKLLLAESGDHFETILPAIPYRDREALQI
jgi:hypothetical protein